MNDSIYCKKGHQGASMKRLTGIILLFIASLANAGNVSTLTVDPDQSQFIVTLPANPTTGYQWTVTEYDKRNLKLIKSYYEPAKTKLMGAGGQMYFVFKKVTKTYPDKTELIFKYAQPWEPENGTLKNITINFSK